MAGEPMPEPLTPPDCDLRGLAFMPLDVIRLMDSDMFARTTGDEFKAALALWCKSWTQVPAGSLPDDDRVLAYLSGAGAKWKKVKPAAIRNWVKCSDGRLYHPTVCEKAMEALPFRRAHEEKKSAEADRKKRERDDRKAMFEVLREAGQVPPYDTSTKDLRAMVQALGAKPVTQPVTDKSVTPVTPVTRTVTAKTGTGTGTLFPEEGKPSSAKPDVRDRNSMAWAYAVEVLTEVGATEAEARSFFAGLLKRHKLQPGDMLPALAQAQANATPDPKSYLTAAAKRIAGGLPPEPPKRVSFV